MLKRRLTEADWFLIAANLLPLYGVWFLNWDPREVFLVYCLETIIIGLFTLLKLGIATAVRKRDWWENQGARTMAHGGFFMFFFLLHYGLFVSVQTSIFLGVAKIAGDNSPGILQLLSHPGRYLGSEAWLMFSVFIFAYGYESLSRFIFTNEYRTKSFGRIMMEPYMRIFVQQFTVILGGFFLAFGAGKIFVFIFTAAKIFFTVCVDYEGILNRTASGDASGKQ